MTSPAEFDRRHGKNAFSRLRSLLDDPQNSYTMIGNKLGLTRQRVSQLAKELGIDTEERRRRRVQPTSPRVFEQGYSAVVAAIIRRIKKAGVQVEPFLSPLHSGFYRWRKSQVKVILNGQVCAIRLSRRFQRWSGGRLIFIFTWATQILLWINIRTNRKYTRDVIRDWSK